MARVVAQTALLPRFTTEPDWASEREPGPGTVFPFGRIENGAAHFDLFAAMFARIRAWKVTLNGSISTSVIDDGLDTMTQAITTGGDLVVTDSAGPMIGYAASAHPLGGSGSVGIMPATPANAVVSEKSFANQFAHIGGGISIGAQLLDVAYAGPVSGTDSNAGSIFVVVTPDWSVPVVSESDNYQGGYTQGHIFATNSHLYFPLHFQLEFGDDRAYSDVDPPFRNVGEFDYVQDVETGATQRFQLGKLVCTLFHVEGSDEVGTLTIKWSHPTEGSQTLAAPIYAIRYNSTHPRFTLLHSYASASVTAHIDVTMECAEALPYGFDPDAPNSFTTLNPIYDTATGEKLV
jgi:hypothetical protein